MDTVYGFDTITLISNGKTAPYDPQWGTLVDGWTLIIPPTYGLYEIPVYSRDTQTWTVEPYYVGVTMYTVDGFIAPPITQVNILPDPSWSLTPNLPYVQRQQIALLKGVADGLIEGPFTSSAMGSPYSYANTSGGWCEFLSVAMAANLNRDTQGWQIGVPVIGPDLWESVIPHTAAEVLQAFNDLQTKIASIRQTLGALVTQIMAITDTSETWISAVQAIVWPNS